jgi:hypothetical protein
VPNGIDRKSFFVDVVGRFPRRRNVKEVEKRQEPFSNGLRGRERLSLQEKNRPDSLFYSSSGHHQT